MFRSGIRIKNIDDERHAEQGERRKPARQSNEMQNWDNKFTGGGKMHGCPAEALVLMGRSYFAAIIASISEIGTTPPCPPAIRAGAMPRCLSAS
jgi:hypothetical protein